MSPKWVIITVTHRSNDCEKEIPGISKPCHDHGEPVELWRRATQDHHEEPQNAAKACTHEHVQRDEPPVHEVLESNAFSQFSEGQAWEEQSEHELTEELECGCGDDLHSWIREKQSYGCEAEKLQ